MKKTSGLWLIFKLLFPIVFNVIFFLLVDLNDLPSSVWISYGAIHLAYFILAFFPFLSHNRSLSMFGISLFSITFSYFVIEFIVGIIFIIARLEGWKWPFIIQFVILILYLFSLIPGMIAGEYAREGKELLRQDAEKAARTDYIKPAVSKLTIAERATTDFDMKSLVQEISAALGRSQIDHYGSEAQKVLGLINQLAIAIPSKNKEKVLELKAAILAAL